MYGIIEIYVIAFDVGRVQDIPCSTGINEKERIRPRLIQDFAFDWIVDGKQSDGNNNNVPCSSGINEWTMNYGMNE